MKILLLLFFTLLGTINVFAQDILAHYGYTTYHSVFIAKDFNNFTDNYCNKTYGFGPVCYQQNGLLYTTSNYFSKKGNKIVLTVDLKFVDLIKCDTTYISSAPSNSITGANLFVDYLGRIYFWDRVMNPDTFALIRSDVKFSDVKILTSLVNIPERIIHDMVILGPDVIALNYNYNELYLLDTNFNYIRTIRPDFQITGLTSIYASCKSKKLIVSGYPYSHEVWDSIAQNQNNFLVDTLYEVVTI